MGLCLNASKAEARLVMATVLLGLFFVWGRIGDSLPPFLCFSVSSVKLEEIDGRAPLTLMEVRSGSDVQIDHRSWV